MSAASQKVSKLACIDFGYFHKVLSATPRVLAAGCEWFGSGDMRTDSGSPNRDDGEAWELPPQEIAGHLVDFYIRGKRAFGAFAPAFGGLVSIPSLPCVIWVCGRRIMSISCNISRI